MFLHSLGEMKGSEDKSVHSFFVRDPRVNLDKKVHGNRMGRKLHMWAVVDSADDWFYVKIPKSASTTLDEYLRKTSRASATLMANNFNINTRSERECLRPRPRFLPRVSENMRRDGCYRIADRGPRCSFTFVRNPIFRLVSGYYEIHKRYSGSKLRVLGRGHFHERDTEPARFRQFVDDMIELKNKFVDGDNVFNHVASQVDSINSVIPADYNLSFIGKIEHFADSLDAMARCCQERCISVPNRFRHYARQRIRNKLDAVGFSRLLRRDEQYAKILNIPSNATTKKLPAIEAIDQATFKKIVSLFRDDFEAFGYSTDLCMYPELNHSADRCR